MARAGALLAALLVCGCKSQSPPPAAPRDDAKRTEPLTFEEVEAEVRRVAPEFGACYRNERRQLFSTDLSEFMLRLRVPNDGGAPEVTVVSASIAGQETLEQCVVTVLSRLRFPSHPGKRITLNIPIKEVSQ